jgi:hypothetical protein
MTAQLGYEKRRGGGSRAGLLRAKLFSPGQLVPLRDSGLGEP